MEGVEVRGVGVGDIGYDLRYEDGGKVRNVEGYDRMCRKLAELGVEIE